MQIIFWYLIFFTEIRNVNAFQNVSHFPSSFFLKKKREREREREMVTEKKNVSGAVSNSACQGGGAICFLFFFIKKKQQKKGQGCSRDGDEWRRKSTEGHVSTASVKRRKITSRYGRRQWHWPRQENRLTHSQTHTHTHTHRFEKIEGDLEAKKKWKMNQIA